MPVEPIKLNNMEPKKQILFMSWRDLILKPLFELGLLLLALSNVMGINRYVGIGFVENVLLFYFFLVAWTLAVLKLLRFLFPFKPGIYLASLHPGQFYSWNLCSFFIIANL